MILAGEWTERGTWKINRGYGDKKRNGSEEMILTGNKRRKRSEQKLMILFVDP